MTDVPLPERGVVRHPATEYGHSRRGVPGSSGPKTVSGTPRRERPYSVAG